MYGILFSYIWIPESPTIWERATDSVYHLSQLFTEVTSCCDVFPSVYCGRSLKVGSCPNDDNFVHIFFYPFLCSI